MLPKMKVFSVLLVKVRRTIRSDVVPDCHSDGEGDESKSRALDLPVAILYVVSVI